MDLKKRIIQDSVIIFYLLIGLEIIIMISPFAAYFYGVYGPLLNLLYAHSATAWLTGFFLPHAVVSKSEFLNFLNGFGRSLFSVSIIVFLIGALQIYTTKIRRRGVVTGMLYKWIRHPQYLFLAIAGLGLLLFWPRFFILVLYISMLFVYYLLARYEENQMLTKYGDSYRDYMQRTAMFIPGEPGRKLFHILFGWIGSHSNGLATSYGVSLTLAILIALGLRSYTISKTVIVNSRDQEIIAISIIPQLEQSLQNILNIAYEDSIVQMTLENLRRKGHKGFLVHVMPQHYMMEGLFAKRNRSQMRSGIGSLRSIIGFIFPFLSSHRHHHDMMGVMSDGPVRLIFSQLTWPNGEYAPFDKALTFTVKHLPLLRVDLNPVTREVLLAEKTSLENSWGQMPMPAF